MSDSQKSNLKPDFKQVLKYLYQILDGIDCLIREFKLFNYPEFEVMINGLIATRVQFFEFINVVNEVEYPDNEPSGVENNNVIPIRELHNESNKNDD